MSPAVTVIVPTLNRPGPLGHALASIAAQRVDQSTVEVVVVNDGGVDVTVTVEGARERGLAVRTVTQPRRLGLPTARNTGMAHARGEYLAFLDDDDVLLPDHLPLTLAALGSAGTDAVYSQCIVSPVRVDPTGPAPEHAGPVYPFSAQLLAVANHMPVHTVVMRRPTRAAFDPALSALEDWDMWLRLAREERFRFAPVPRATVVYHRLTDAASMCANTTTGARGLAGFGVLVQQLWRRWPARTARSDHFRLYVAVMYWQALARLSDGHRLPDAYFQATVEHLAAVWHGAEPEAGLIDRIVAAIGGDPCVVVAA